MIEKVLSEAKNKFIKKKFQESLDIYIRILKEYPDYENKVELLRSISNCMAWLGDFSGADEYSKLAISECEIEYEKKYYEALYLNEHNDYVKSKSLFEQLLLNHSDKFDRGNLETFIAFNLVELHEYSAALDYFKKGHSLLDSEKNPFLYSNLLFEYASVLSELDYIEQSDKIYNECESYLFYLNLPSLLTFYYLRASKFFRDKRYKEALKYANRLYDIIQDNIDNIPEDKTDFYLLLSNIYRVNENFESALNFLSKIQAIPDDEWKEFQYLENMSICLFELKKFSEAKQYLSQIILLPKTKKINENREYSFRKILGIILFELEDFIAARNVFIELVEFSKEYNIDSSEIQVYLNKLKS